ncbi:hypothetical protein PMAYCL1PPCAC_10813 [Pristionchus mayeri]|uniref:Ion channel n=1 Tax=Pristionchus mayeri TaxID=1317129 RepID=A0AAN4ZLJ1_9BILA|nr:hypothetical protein PMAYCL1PPCAC_10805 [Pristionchus mayeri]GMR40618.1 hypothetical protein PMAYCL1PPCAC_10813 [Pristionchus mayeri]
MMIQLLCLVLQLMACEAKRFCGSGCNVLQDPASGMCHVSCVSGNLTDAPSCQPPSNSSSSCGPFITADGALYPNRCVTLDRDAECREEVPRCICSANFIGPFCSLNREHMGTVGTMLGGNGNNEDLITKLLGEISKSKNSGSAPFIAPMPSILSAFTEGQVEQFGYDIEDMLISATYEEKLLHLREDFKKMTSPSLGNCYTFNHFNSSLIRRIRRVGQSSGLRIETDSHPNDYVPWSENVGVAVYVQSVGMGITSESRRFSVVPGGVERIILKKSSFNRAGRCVRNKKDAQSFYVAGNYSVEGCLRACHQDMVYRTCACMDAAYEKKAGVAGCSFDKLPCVSSVSEERGDPSTWRECHCPPPCEEELFEYMMSRSTYLNGSTRTREERKSRVMIYFESLEMSISHETYKMPFAQLIGQVGGAGGLLLGITASFIVEVALLCIILGGCLSKYLNAT